MVVVILMGGLGNQMFQYSFGLAQSVKMNSKFQYYFDPKLGSIKRNFGLQIFNLSAKPVVNKLFLFLYRLCFSTITENDLSFTDYSKRITNNSILKGYWQSEKYFIDYEPEIRREFSFNEKLEGKNKYLAEIINKSDAVSIHIRRGDYLSDKNTNAFHGICDLEYYKNAMKTIEKKIKRPTYFFFSDDPAWVKKNLLSKYETHYIDWNSGEESYRDMQLMSLCDHNIIANSSFSWWGAWLNNNPSKIVIAPKIWYRDGSINTKDLVPDKWVRI